ncbi:MAG TPA: hypothetical protein VD770_01025, partial [Coxiellaceae bacterium]|nr:hypothetical protein [Coxiellaceae bacterium]
MLRRTSATVAPAPQNPVSPVREVAEDREPADHSFPWGLYILLTLIVLSMGGGGIATLFSLLDEKLSAGAHYAAIVLTSISAMALSAFIIKGLGDIKVNGKMLLDKIGPVGSDARNRAEKKAGLGTRS